MTLAVIFLAVGLTYAGAFVIGWHRPPSDGSTLSSSIQRRRQFTDPLTARFQRWHDRAKMNALRQKQWARLWLLLSANNLIAVALVSRTLYGVTLVLPLYFTWRQGIAQGALLSRPSMRPSGVLVRVALLEVGAYLLATALGVNLVISLIARASLLHAVRLLIVLYPIVAAAVCGGAWLEVRWLRAHMPEEFRLPATLNAEEIRVPRGELWPIHRLVGPSAVT